MTAALVRAVLDVAAWGLACAWCVRAFGAVRGMPKLPDLATMMGNRSPLSMPSLTVVVPARNEAAHIAATLQSLVVQDYMWMQICVVNDRSTDTTGAIIDEFAARYPKRVHAMHITELPEGWLGKTHAMHIVATHSHAQFLLFTDADVIFEPTILRRALAYIEREKAAHLVVAPTLTVRSWGEGTMLGFFQVMSIWALRPWCVADPTAQRDAIGVGAFNLVRRDALEQIGGLEPQRLSIIEDATLGIRIKAARLPQRLAVAPGMVNVHWAPGGRGIVKVMTKNLFSAVNFRPLLLLGACVGILLLFLAPLAGLFGWWTLLPSLISLLCIAMAYRAMQRMTSINTRYFWTYPIGTVAFVWALLRSMLAAWIRRGVVWRGTHYPLSELRKHNSPMQWRR
ncbi:MAG TPA: glycosyltransferase [Acidobacteriaceae bacterium]|jgi:glycosyltransferase involved in cell wall biosynthesis